MYPHPSHYDICAAHSGRLLQIGCPTFVSCRSTLRCEPTSIHSLQRFQLLRMRGSTPYPPSRTASAIAIAMIASSCAPSAAAIRPSAPRTKLRHSSSNLRLWNSSGLATRTAAKRSSIVGRVSTVVTQPAYPFPIQRLVLLHPFQHCQHRVPMIVPLHHHQRAVIFPAQLRCLPRQLLRRVVSVKLCALHDHSPDQSPARRRNLRPHPRLLHPPPGCTSGPPPVAATPGCVRFPCSPAEPLSSCIRASIFAVSNTARAAGQKAGRRIFGELLGRPHAKVVPHLPPEGNLLQVQPEPLHQPPLLRTSRNSSNSSAAFPVTRYPASIHQGKKCRTYPVSLAPLPLAIETSAHSVRRRLQHNFPTRRHGGPQRCQYFRGIRSPPCHLRAVQVLDRQSASSVLTRGLHAILAVQPRKHQLPPV